MDAIRSPPQQRARTGMSLRLRILLTTLVLLAVALGIAVFSFERVAESIVSDALHSHLSARADEVQESLQRFQRERRLVVATWAAAEAMQLTLDSGDPKFAEDHLRKTIQDQAGAFTAAELIDMHDAIVALVRDAPKTEDRGIPVPEARGTVVDVAFLRSGAKEDEVSVTLAPLRIVVPGGGDAETIVMSAPVRDFAGDRMGWIVAALGPKAIPQLLSELSGRNAAYLPIVADRERRVVLTIPQAEANALRPIVTAKATGAPGTLERIDRGKGWSPVYAVRTAGAGDAPGWSTLMVVDADASRGRLTQLRFGLMSLFGLVLAGAAITAVLALRQAAKPLGDVAASMQRVAGGDLTTRVRDAYAGELGQLASAFNTMVEEVARSHDELQRTEALRREVEIAHQIQTAILPVSPAVPGYEVAARMKPADDVGGDLYDILAFGDTFWVLVGDVSGHGINSGLVMMMAQAAAYSAIAEDPHATPGAVINAVNRVVHENVRKRMRRDDYLTLMAARHMGGGRFVAAGAHQPVFIARGGGKVDLIEPQGPWVGLTPNVQPPPMPEYEFVLGPGDLVFFVTDGLLEAKDGTNQMFGEDRLRAVLAKPEVPSAPQALSDVFGAVEAFSQEQADDMTGVVLRRKHELA
jgi:sigma-B regulation protein RsbU (phosphoserine phosphatase)